MTDGRHTLDPYRSRRLGVLGLAALAALAVPFSVTAVYRISDRSPTALPFVLIVGLAATLLMKKEARPVAIGLIVGAVVSAVLLILLSDTIGRGVSEFSSY